MGQSFAKVLTPFAGKPLIVHLLEAIKNSDIDPKPVIVLGFDRDRVRKELGEKYDYVIQEEQLGTGHAVQCAEGELRGTSDAVLVLYGDQPFLKPETIRKIAELHKEIKPVITMATVTVPDFKSWRATFYDFGRIVRNHSGEITAIVEKKDATEAELNIREVNPSYFCFDADWLWRHLPNLNQENAQGEFYLTDLVRIAVTARDTVASVAVDPKESIGINTPDHLELAEGLHKFN